MARVFGYYRQFEAMTEEEVNAVKKERYEDEKRKALERVEPLDLSRTTWPGLPHPAIVNAITFAARKGLQRYVDPRATELRSELAHLLGAGTERIVVGNGAEQLRGSAAVALLEAEDELVCPWPSYPLYPVMARRAGAHAVPVPGFGADALLAAVNDRTRVVCVCNPNDPTGELMERDELERLLGELPERVVVLLDEALVEYADRLDPGTSIELLDEHPRLLVFRSFSKAWGLAGLRCGYAVGAEESGALLERLEPELGVNDLAHTGALEALRATPERIVRRAEQVAAERDRALEAVRGLGVDAPDSQANVLWLRAGDLDGAELARRLERHGVIVQPGGALGAHDRVRASVHLPEHVDRLVHALGLAL
jgi:histidinol-phosphate aminotransferase